MNKDILRRPFGAGQTKTRPGQHGKTVTYVDVATVLQRLHEACEVVTFEVLRHEILEDEVVVVGRLSADGVVNVDFGCSSITRDVSGMPVSIGDDLKAASSDCIKRCARLLGCPLDLHTHTERSNGAAHRARPAGAVAERITPRQFEAIKRACRQRNVDRTELHALIGRKTGKDGVQNLTKTEASAVLTELTGANGIQ
jgi:hypothetical protein